MHPVKFVAMGRKMIENFYEKRYTIVKKLETFPVSKNEVNANRVTQY